MNWLEKLKRVRGFPVLCAGLCVGVLLMMIPRLLPAENAAEQSKNSAQSDTLQAYGEMLEHKIAQMAQALSGVSDASVLVTLECSEETVYAEERTVSGKEAYATSYLLRAGSEPVAVREITPRIRGIAVVCRGGDDPAVQLALISMLTSAFDLSASRVFVGAK